MFGFFRKKQDVFSALYGPGAQRRAPKAEPSRVSAAPAVAATAAPVISVDDMPVARAAVHRSAVWDGEKYYGGFGPTEYLYKDYWTLRARSSELFERNLYARGLVRRLVTNEINTGLHLEATPIARLLGRDEESLAEWSEDVEAMFGVWASERDLCSQNGSMTWGELQAQVRLEAIVAGDVLVVNRRDPRTKLPRIELIDGAKVQTPLWEGGDRNIRHGVELGPGGRHVAYWVLQDDGSYKRLPAWGEKSGRRLAWLVYGTEKRLDEVRGQPLLALVLQSLKEIDRYRDSVQRKAVINAMVAMFIKSTEDRPGSKPITGGGISRRTATVTDTEGEERTFNVAEHLPGLVLDKLQPGEEPHGFLPNGTDEKFGDFEAAIVVSVAWGCEIPPEILTLSFSNNYSASQAAINEFKMYLDKFRVTFGAGFCSLVYTDWLYSSVLVGKIDAPGLLVAWQDPGRYEVRGAWICSDWSGHIKPAVDAVKLVRAAGDAIELGLTTRRRAARELFGVKWSQVVKELKRENQQMAEANAPLQSSENPPAQQPTDDDEDDDVDQEDETENERALHVVT